MKTILIITMTALLSLCFLSCRTSVPVESTHIRQTDSIGTLVRERIVPVRVAGPSFQTQLEIRCDPVTGRPELVAHKQAASFPVFDTDRMPGWYRDGPRAGVLTTEMNGGRLKISFDPDSLIAEIRARDSVISRQRTIETERVDVRYVRQVRWYDTASHCVTAAVLAYGLYRAGGYMYKLKRTIT